MALGHLTIVRLSFWTSSGSCKRLQTDGDSFTKQQAAGWRRAITQTGHQGSCLHKSQQDMCSQTKKRQMQIPFVRILAWHYINSCNVWQVGPLWTPENYRVSLTKQQAAGLRPAISENVNQGPIIKKIRAETSANVWLQRQSELYARVPTYDYYISLCS